MNMTFSPQTQLFYDVTYNDNIPADAISLTDEQYYRLLNARNHGYHILSDLTLSERPRDAYEVWSEITNHWVDKRTPEELAQALSSKNKAEAQHLYDTASKQITALLQQIEDEDGDLDALEAQKKVLSEYRKILRAYLKTDAMGDLPTTP